MIIIICTECNSIVKTCYVQGGVQKGKAYKAYCKCSMTLGRSEKRAMSAFKYFNDTEEREVNHLSNKLDEKSVNAINRNVEDMLFTGIKKFMEGKL